MGKEILSKFLEFLSLFLNNINRLEKEIVKGTKNKINLTGTVFD